MRVKPGIPVLVHLAGDRLHLPTETENEKELAFGQRTLSRNALLIAHLTGDAGRWLGGYPV